VQSSGGFPGNSSKAASRCTSGDGTRRGGLELRNLVDERPTRDLHGRVSFARSFVELDDCADRDVLDIGCGFGWFELVALDRGATSITGLEPSDSDLATARRSIDDERVTFRVGSATELPFADASFDTVVCWEVLEHLPKSSEQRAFDEISRVLRPGGVLYLSTPHAAPVATALDPARWLIGHRHYTRAQLRSYASAAGFDVVRLELRGRWWEMAQTLDLYVAKWLFRRRPFFDTAITHRVDAEWQRPGFSNVFLRARKRDQTPK
jgi:ubiquinone/menaquinone biosynthesis C-methylase UbiE